MACQSRSGKPQASLVLSGAGRLLRALSADGSRTKRSTFASRSQLEQRRADVDRYRQSGTEPTLNEMLREPAIRLMMTRDNVTEDQLLHLIKLACRHIKG